MLTTPEIMATVRRATTEGKALKITGYRDSSGNVSNFTVLLIGSAGYHDLVRRSLAQINQTNNPGTFDLATWNQAVSEKKASWERTLSGAQAEKQTHVDYQDVGGFFVDRQTDAIVLKNMRVIAREDLQKSEKQTNSRPLTLAKKSIDEQSPVNEFIGQLNLSPEKVVNVEVLE